MVRLLSFLCLVFSIIGIHCAEDPEADFRKLPKLFHLDDYERCLERKDGIYCLGLFDVYSDVQPNPIYDIIQVKSQDVHLYNRSYLHRGYCLPTRCPSREANASARFERCADAWARGHSLRARLRTLHYCRAHGQPRPREPDTADLPHRLVLYFVCTMLVMAVVGTVYDLCFAKKERKNPFLMSFSLRINWKHLTSNIDDMNFKELEPLHLLRFYLGITVVTYHVYILTTATYQRNPRLMEKVLYSPFSLMMAIYSPFTMSYILISNFITSFSLLLLSKKHDFSLKHFPLIVLKRVIRMYPVYLLLNGFAATWYKSFGEGPMWPVFVAYESDVCRKKFWVTALFLQNFINKKEICLVQTWMMAVDIQLHLITLFVTLVLLKRRQHAIKILSALLLATVVLLAYQAFKKDLIPVYLYQTPEVFRSFLIIADSFFDLYINPLSAAIVAIAGTMLAFIHVNHKERDANKNRSKVLLFLCILTISLIFLWIFLGYKYFLHYDRWIQHVMVVVERLVSAFLMSLLLYCAMNHKGIAHKLSWSVLQPMTKLSFSVSMCHWCINVLVVTSRWTLHDSSHLQILIDSVAVYVLAHIVAVPLVLLVELPMQKFLNRLINQLRQQCTSPMKEKEQ